jgi:hypothetical protein
MRVEPALERCVRTADIDMTEKRAKIGCRDGAAVVLEAKSKAAVTGDGISLALWLLFL